MGVPVAEADELRRRGFCRGFGRGETSRGLFGFRSPAAQTGGEFAQGLTNAGGPQTALEFPASCVEHGPGIAFVEIALEEVTQDQRYGLSVRIHDEHRAVVVGARHFKFADGSAIEQPKAELPQAGLLWQGPAIDRGKELWKPPLKLQQRQLDALNVTIAEHTRGVGHARDQHIIGPEDFIGDGQGISAVVASLPARGDGLRAARALQIRTAVRVCAQRVANTFASLEKSRQTSIYAAVYLQTYCFRSVARFR